MAGEAGFIQALPDKDAKPSEVQNITFSTIGTRRPLDVTSIGAGPLSGVVWDYMSLAVSPATTETYTFKSGGSGGTTVKTITIVYTSSTRETISTVTVV